MNLTQELGKSPWKSWTVWGLAIFAGGEAVVNTLCGPSGADVLGEATCTVLGDWIDKIGIVLAGLGLRRATPKK